MEIAGFILIGSGAYIISNPDQYLGDLSGGIGGAAIAIGVIVTIISFLGCFGAANEKRGLLKTYFYLLVVIIILEISIGIAAYAKSDEV